MLHLSVSAVAGMLLLLHSAAHALAEIGVALDIGRIDVEQRLAKGGTYQLPTVGVRNPGTETSVYEMSAGYLERQPERRPPERWFTFTPERFTLEPGASMPVRVTLTIPTDADPADYHALLRAQIAPAGVGAQVGAAAAARLTFTVKPSTILEAWWLRADTALRGRAPWSYLIIGVGVLGASSWWLGRHYRLGLRVERRP